jgi:DNA polymerase-3 subunit alpha
MYLNCKTYFSYRYGTLGTEELVTLAAQNGANALALTNINNTSDVWDFVDFCTQQGIKPIAGVEIRNTLDDTTPGSEKLLYLLLARDNYGLLEINRFLTGHLQTKQPFPPQPVFSEHVWIVFPFGHKPPDQLALNELLGVAPAEVNKLYGFPVAKYAHKMVIRHPVTFQNKTYYNLHRLLRAIDQNTLLSKLDPIHTAPPHETWVPPTFLLEAFQQYPGIVTNTLQVMESCHIDMEFHTDKNKKTFSATPEDDRIFLEKLALDGVQYRFGKKNKTALQRVQKELKIINDLGFNAYFLIAWDVIRYAQSRGFYYVGRGSGANSIVAYCLQITDVNPIELDLYFERFLNPYRTSPPDFDIDFSWKDRDEVIDYIFKRYGKEHVALLGMYDTFQYRAVIRELGKVFGLPKTEMDKLSNATERDLTKVLNGDHIQKLILQYGKLMVNFPNHLSIHPGGMLISEAPIYQYGAVDMPPKGFGTTQMDMFVAEKIGLYKLDILSQRGLGHIKDAIQLVRENKEKDIDIHRVEKFKKDPQVAAQIRKADTIGCFYIESPAMRQLLKKLKCDDYITLTAASSIIRPGVSKSGMMKEYIHRFHHPESFTYLHPKMKELLEETYGVMVYQEDVIKVAHHFAGLDMGEADILRRAMSGKYRGKKEIMRIRDTFFANCKERGYPEAISAEVWRQIESFSGYSFSKAHSASFAVESYQSLYLKTYYPMEFMVAVINNFGGFYNTELYFHELKRAGAVVHAPCVNNSDQLTNISGNVVYVGLIHIQNMEDGLIETILTGRALFGAYASLHDFMQRTGIGQEQLNTLIRVGALRFTGKNKKELLWEANFLRGRGVAVGRETNREVRESKREVRESEREVRESKREVREGKREVGEGKREVGAGADAVVGVITNNSENADDDTDAPKPIRFQKPYRFSETDTDEELDAFKPIRSQRPYRFSAGLLFEDDPVTFELPQLAQHPLDDALDELEILGFSLCNPFDLVDDWVGGVDVVGRETNREGGCVPAGRMQDYLGQTITMLGYLITWKPVHTVKKEMMYFGTYIDAAGDWLDTVHFPDSAKVYPLQGRGFYRMTGRVVEEFGVFNLEVHRMHKIGIKDRAAAKVGGLLEKDKSWKQGLIRRE